MAAKAKKAPGLDTGSIPVQRDRLQAVARLQAASASRKTFYDAACARQHEEERDALYRAECACEVRCACEVVVVRGRKVAHGTVGRVFWMGDRGYGVSVGCECADGSKFFTAVGNVVVWSVEATA